MNILKLSQQRFSVRKYTNEPINKNDLEYILEVARMAPSACNCQPWKFVFIEDHAAQIKLQQCYDREWFRSAPLYIICMKNIKENCIRKYDDKPYGDIDVAIATEHICLAATERGLGTCWVCNFDPDKMKVLFHRDDYEAVAIVAIGHIAEDCPQNKKKRKDINDIIEIV